MSQVSSEVQEKVSIASGVVGTVAIVWGFFEKGGGLANFLDMLKDMAGLAVVIVVFFMTIKLLRRQQTKDFVAIFEEKLMDWVRANEYLVCLNEGKAVADEAQGPKRQGRLDRRSILMVKDHSRFVTQTVTAASANLQEKVVFLRLPTREERQLDFRFSPSVFDKSGKWGEKPGINEIITTFSGCLEKSYCQGSAVGGGFRVGIAQDNAEKSIVVSFGGDDFEETEENAGKLVGMVEYVKTMVLAMA